MASNRTSTSKRGMYSTTIRPSILWKMYRLTEFYRDRWAKTTSPNPDVKIYIGAPASPQAADSGYVDSENLAKIIESTRSQYSSFGGVMLWDADSAHSEPLSPSLIA